VSSSHCEKYVRAVLRSRSPGKLTAERVLSARATLQAPAGLALAGGVYGVVIVIPRLSWGRASTIVMTSSLDPMATGFVASLARQGSNVCDGARVGREGYRGSGVPSRSGAVVARAQRVIDPANRRGRESLRMVQRSGCADQRRHRLRAHRSVSSEPHLRRHGRHDGDFGGCRNQRSSFRELMGYPRLSPGDETAAAFGSR
jgi:hypothetical protein